MNSHSYNMSKFEKEKQKLIQEKCQTILNDMLRDEDNKYCVDCDAKGPRWASWNLGIFLCIRCAGIHRNLGVHISRVKSVNLDSWTPEQVVTMQQMGNSRARAIYEANMPDSLRRPQTDSSLESFIRAKYEHKKYIAKEWVQPGPVRVNWDADIEESIRKTKEAKKAVAAAPEIKHIPTPTAKPAPSTPAVAPPKAPVIDISKIVASQQIANPNPTPNGHSLVSTSASEDLLGLTTDSLSLTSTNLLPTQQPSNTAATTNVITSDSDDLGSIFLSSPASSGSTDLGKMSKESILSLYGSGPTTPSGGVNPFIPSPGPTGGSPFGGIGNMNLQSSGLGGQSSSFSQQGQGGGAYGYNPNQSTNFPGQLQHSMQQQATHNPFPGFQQNQMGVSSPGFGGLPQRNDMVQIQNQFPGLNLGNQPSPQTQLQKGFGVGQNHGGNMGSPFMAPQMQNFGQFPPNIAPMNSQFQPPRADNLPGLGNSVSQLMQPNLSGGSSFWK